MRSTAMARSALALGIVGLFTAGLCGLGAVLGLVLGIAAVAQARRSGGGGSVAWAAVSANVFALISVAPWILLIVTLRPELPENPFAEPELPQPHAPSPELVFVEPVPPPPPPPPPPPAPRAPREPRAASAPTDDSREVSEAEEGRVLGGGPSRAVRVGGSIAEPTRTRYVNPAYPDIARSARVQGIVILEATIGPDGRVSEVRVLRHVPLLDQAAIDAVRQWEYTPTLVNGVPVPVIMTVTVNFRLS
jgi:TonB family protein